MSKHCKTFTALYRIPKARIRRKIEKSKYRGRYEAFCRRRGESAEYNTHGLLVWVRLWGKPALESEQAGREQL